MATAVPIVSLGLSAVSTVSGLSAQRRQAAAQKAQIDAQITTSRQQLQLAQSQFKAARSTAKMLREREQLLINEQQKQALLQQREAQLRQQAELVQVNQQASQMQEQAKQQASQIIAQAESEATSITEASVNELQQLVNAFTGNEQQLQTAQALFASMTGGNASPGMAQEALQDNTTLQTLAEYQQSLDNSNTLGRVRDANLNHARATSAIQQQMAGVGADYLRNTGSNQEQLNSIINQLAIDDINYTTARNRISANAAYKSGQAASNMQEQAAMYANRGETASLLAQRRAVDSPGLLSYIGAGLGLFNQAMSSGVIDPTRWGNRTSSPAVPVGYQNAPSYSIRNDTRVTPLGGNTSPIGRSGQIVDVTGKVYG